MKSEKKDQKTKNKKVVEADIVENKTKKADKSKVEKKKEKTKKSKKTKGEGFFKEVIKELKRVKWPDKKYMVKYSMATFGTIILSSLYFYLIFALFSYLKGLV